MEMSQRFARDASLRAFSRPCCAVTLPGTMARASSVPGSVSMITFLGIPFSGAAGEFAGAVERAFPRARVAGAPTKVTAARTRAMHAAIAAPREVALRAEMFGRVTAWREFLWTPGERSEDSALQSFTDCGIIIGITSGQGPPAHRMEAGYPWGRAESTRN